MELGLATRLSYGVGQAAEGIKNSAFAVFLLFFYSQVLGLSAAWAGVALLLALLFDAVTDPVIGSISDSLRTRWGRRHPLLYAAALPVGASFALVFHPPRDLGPTALFAWLLVGTVLARAAMTLYHVPHLALGAELSRGYAERTVVVAYRIFFGFLGAAVFFASAGEVFFRPTPEFPNGQLNPAAYPALGLCFGAMMTLLILVSAVGTHSRIPFLPRPTGSEAFSSSRVVGEMRAALANRSFRTFFVAVLAFLVARGLADGTGVYMGTYFWELETAHIFRLTVVSLLGILVGAPLWSGPGRRLDKRTAFLTGCSLYVGIMGTGPVLKLVGLFPPLASPLYLPILYGFSFLASVGAAGAMVSAGSMLADVADEHELATGRRQEGVFFGAISFSGKAAAGVGGWLAGMALTWIRFPVQAEPADVPAGTVLGLALVAGPGVFLLGALGVGLARRYELTRERHAAIRAQLDAREGVAPAPGS